MTEKRLLELRIQDLEHRLYGSSSEKLPIEDRQLALIDEVFDNPEPATTEDVVVAPESGRRRGCFHPRRPPTPPDVRFRIRRFMKTEASASE